MSEIPKKQSNFIPLERPKLNKEEGRQDITQHVTMVDRDLQHLFQYAQDLSDFVSAISSSVVSSSSFVDRGDPSATDFDEGDLTQDGGWYDLDLSSIVPSGAIAVLLLVWIKDDAVNTVLQFRKNGNSDIYNTSILRTQVVNVFNDADTIVACDSNRVIEYKASAAITSLGIIVRGWWV